MRTINLVLPMIIVGPICSSASAETDITGEYACIVFEKGGVASIHLEDADPPRAYAEHEIQSTFGMRIDAASDGAQSYLVTETEDRGENPDLTDYDTKNSVLHGVYYGDGMNFTADEDQGFLRLHHQKDGGVYFYHAGFEYPGGVDVRLSVRFGECKPKS